VAFGTYPGHAGGPPGPARDPGTSQPPSARRSQVYCASIVIDGVPMTAPCAIELSDDESEPEPCGSAERKGVRSGKDRSARCCSRVLEIAYGGVSLVRTDQCSHGAERPVGP